MGSRLGLALVSACLLAGVLVLPAPAVLGGFEVLREQYAPAAWDTSFANVYIGQDVAQSFVAHSSFLLTRLELYAFDQPQSSSPDILQVFLAADAGNRPGPVLASTAQQGSQNWSWVPFSFYPWVPLNVTQRYWIVASDSQPRPKGYEWAMNAPADYAFGEAQWYNPSSGAWTNNTGADLFFKAYGISGPSLSLEVSPRAGPVDPGADVPIHIWFNNSGNEPAGTVTVSLALDENLSYLGDDASSSGGIQTAPGTWTFNGVDIGAHELTVWTRVEPSVGYYDGESLEADVSVNYTDPSGTPQNPLRASASVTVLVSVIRTQVTPSPAHVDPGASLNYTVSMLNVGSGRAADVWINASSGPRLTLLGSDAANAGGVSVGPFAWRFSNVSGQTYAFNVTAQADPAAMAGDRLTLLLSVSYTDGLGHPLGSYTVVSEASVHGPSLVVVAALDAVRSRPGDVLHLTLFANNTGDATAERVWINATLPTRTTLLGSYPAATSAVNGSLMYAIPSVSPGPLAVSLALQVAADALPGTVLESSVHLDVLGGSGTILRPSVDGVASLVVSPRFLVSLTSTASSPVHAGDRIDLLLRIENAGNEAASLVWVNLSLPEETLLVNSTLPWASTNGTAYGWTFEDVGSGELAIGVRIEVSARLASAETLVGRLALAYARGDGAVFAAPEAIVALQSVVEGFPSGTLQMLLLWAAILAAVFLLFLLLAYMDLLPHRRPLIDDVFLLHNSGILICHYSTTLRPDVDSDIASGMLMAVRNFVADALKTKNGALQELRYGDYRIHMAHGQHAILVVFTRGGRTKSLAAKMQAVLRNVEAAYGATLESWSGRTEDFKGVEEVLLKLVES